VGGIPPAEPSQFCSDIFKQTPPSFYQKTALAKAVLLPGRFIKEGTFSRMAL